MIVSMLFSGLVKENLEMLRSYGIWTDTHFSRVLEHAW